MKLNTKLPYWAAVASQNGTRTSVFNLGYSGSGQDHWVFAMHGSDADTPTTNVGAWSAETVQAGVWTHLAATYNAATGEVQLYVNGRRFGSGRLLLIENEWAVRVDEVLSVTTTQTRGGID